MIVRQTTALLIITAAQRDYYTARHQSRSHGGIGEDAFPHFPKDQFWDSFKSDEKVGKT